MQGRMIIRPYKLFNTGSRNGLQEHPESRGEFNHTEFGIPEESAIADLHATSDVLLDELPEAALRTDVRLRFGSAIRRDGGQTENALHVLNAPSPAATASLPIGREIAKRVTLSR